MPLLDTEPYTATNPGWNAVKMMDPTTLASMPNVLFKQSLCPLLGAIGISYLVVYRIIPTIRAIADNLKELYKVMLQNNIQDADESTTNESTTSESTTSEYTIYILQQQQQPISRRSEGTMLDADT